MANDWLSLDTLRELCPQMAGVSDAACNIFVNGTMAAIDKHVGYDFTYSSTARTFHLDACGGHVVQLPTLAPVWSVSAVYLDRGGNYGQTTGSFDATASLLTLGTDYTLDLRTHNTDVMGPYTGVIRRLNAHWPQGQGRKEGRLANHVEPVRGCIKVTAVTGFKNGAPADVVMAAYQAVSAAYLSRTGIGAVLSQSVDGVSKSYGTPAGTILEGESAPFITPFLKAVLRPYRRAVLV